MAEENITQEFRLKNVIETRNYFMKEIDQNELMSMKHKNIWNFIEHYLILTPAITGCVSVSLFLS